MADETPDNLNAVPPSEGNLPRSDAPPSGAPSGGSGGVGASGGAAGSGIGSGAKPPSRERGLIEGAIKQMGGAKFTFSPKPPSLAKEAIPGYEITREIHRGGQGVVYQALQHSTQKKVAIKVMHGGVFASATDRARIEREVRILANLNHPNIVKVYDSGEVQGAYYYVMDYISGHSLDSYIRSGPHAIEQTLKLFTTICEAVNAAHLKGVIHRDLKPGNIRIDAEGTPHILDFGLAKLALDEHTGGQQMTATGQFVGSLYWASPEQALGNPSTIDIRTDVYSLGVILYQMLTVGKFPYEVLGNMRDVLDNIMRAEPAKPSTVRRQINDEVETIVLKCLQKERDRRYQSAGDVGRDIVRYLTGEPIEAKRESGLYVIGKNLRKHKGAVVSIGAIVAILAASGVVFSVLYANEKAANKATIAAKAVADSERERAERNAKEVRTLALSFMLDVADKLENLRGATKTREGVLRTAKDSLARLAAEPGAGDDLQLQKELADAWARVGAIEGGMYLPRVGTVAASVTSYAQARTIRETLLAKSPNDPQLLAAMAASRRHTGQGLQRQRKFDEAKLQFDAALNDLDKAIAAAGSSTLSLELAEKKLTARMDLADLAKVRAAELRDIEKSPAMVSEAMKVYDEVELYWSERLKLNPADEKSARSLGVIRDKKAQTQVALGRSLMAAMATAIKNDKLEEAKALAVRSKQAFESARDLAEIASAEFEKLALENPANRQIKRDHYLAVYNVGDANMRLAELVGDAAEKNLLETQAADADAINEMALAKFRQALDIADRLASADDSNLEAIHDLGLALNKVGNPLRSLNRIDDAAIVFERSLALREDLNKTDPTDQHLKDLAVGQYKRGEILELSADRTTRTQQQRIADLVKAVSMFEKALETYTRQAEAKLEVRPEDVKLVKESLERSREKLGKLKAGG